jgi:hypothetical protein
MRKPFSPIQDHILSKLKNADYLQYSKLTPSKKIPNDLFNYHLQFLVKKGLIERTPKGYSLSKIGVRHVANPLPFDDSIKILFKYNVITIVSKKEKGKIYILNQLRKSHPSFGKIGCPGGVVRKGEPTVVAAKRKLKVETGLDADFKIVGIERRRLYVKGGLFSDFIFPIAYTDSHAGTLVNTEFGENMWVPIDQAIKNESVEFDSIKSIVTVLKAIKGRRINRLPFFFEDTMQEGEEIEK